MPNQTIAAVLLAAGASRRMGQPKALLRIGGHYSIDIILANLKQAGCEPIIPVLGNDAQQILEKTTVSEFPFVRNLNPEDGMLSSLKRGIQSLPSNCSGVIWALVDHPFVQIPIYQKLIDLGNEFPQRIIVPQFKGRHGHPVYVGRFLFDELLQAPEAIGANVIFRKHREQIVYLDVEDEGVLGNVNTPDELEYWLNK